MQKRLAVIEDLSCFGKCSLTVALPVIACMGIECCPLPTALLSGHFAALPEVSVLDLTERMGLIADQWAAGEVRFDGLLSGYLSSPAQVEQVRRLADRFREPETLFVVDPAMADRGRLYRGFTQTHVDAMRTLCREAAVVLPNLTEACLLLDQPYSEEQSREGIERLAHGMLELGAKAVVLTGVQLREGYVGAACCAGGEVTVLDRPRVPGHYNGTGDIFASVLTGSLLQGSSLTDAADRAVDFTSRVIAETAKNPTHRPYGVDLEQCLHLLTEEVFNEK